MARRSRRARRVIRTAPIRGSSPRSSRRLSGSIARRTSSMVTLAGMSCRSGFARASRREAWPRPSSAWMRGRPRPSATRRSRSLSSSSTRSGCLRQQRTAGGLAARGPPAARTSALRWSSSDQSSVHGGTVCSRLSVVWRKPTRSSWQPTGPMRPITRPRSAATGDASRPPFLMSCRRRAIRTVAAT